MWKRILVLSILGGRAVCSIEQYPLVTYRVRYTTPVTWYRFISLLQAPFMLGEDQSSVYNLIRAYFDIEGPYLFVHHLFLWFFRD